MAFPADTKSKHEGIWSDGYHSDNLVTGKGYYCSKRDSFKAGKGSEKVLVTMPKALSSQWSLSLMVILAATASPVSAATDARLDTEALLPEPSASVVLHLPFSLEHVAISPV